MMPEPPDMQPGGHVYMFVRRDLPLADQMVQVAHVSLEAGQRFCVPCHCPLVLLEVADEPELQRALRHCRRHDIPTHTFTEPDATEEFPHKSMGLTAACTPPLNPAQRKRLRHFMLWHPPS